ncbi:hypothetical protein AMTR_s00058p00155830 [Amborella trichopoda]|uniref:Uncharacterized protein n=1 Tax=Amborella trichopoda TaxID=13333 RepID=W1P9L7_AMBTC|nr:hypothetical protein AMTR_s00058p00155830 [Amborella trichopoda]
MDEAPAVTTSERQNLKHFPLQMQLVAVSSSEALISTIAHVEDTLEPHIPSSELLALASQEPAVLVEPPSS